MWSIMAKLWSRFGKDDSKCHFNRSKNWESKEASHCIAPLSTKDDWPILCTMRVLNLIECDAHISQFSINIMYVCTENEQRRKGKISLVRASDQHSKVRTATTCPRAQARLCCRFQACKFFWIQLINSLNQIISVRCMGWPLIMWVSKGSN